MLARGEAFAVKSGVPAQAAAHAVHFAVQIGAAVRAVIEQFILAAVGFEICHADPGQPYGHAPREQFAEQFLGGDEQFAPVVGGFAEPHRLVCGKMVHITEVQAEGARLLAVLAQGPADPLAEILDQAAEKFRVDGAAFNGGFARNGFRRRKHEHFAAVEAAGALPDLLADGSAEGRLQGGLRHAAQLADGGDAVLGQRAGMHVADAVELLDRQRRQERLFFAGRDHAEAVRPLQPRGDRGDHLRARRAKRNAQPSAAEDFRLQAPQRGFVIRVEPLGAGKVEVKVVERRGFDRRRVRFQDASHAFGKISVVFVLAGDNDGSGANAQRFAEAHRGFHAKRLRLVARGCVASASYQAKALGVKTAMSFREALRVCPRAIVVPGQYEHYADFAEGVRRILETYTPAVETAALDDFYLDFAGTERLYPDYEATLRRLQAEIFSRTRLSVSLGAARTKVVASIASRLERPHGFRMVAPGEEESFLTPLPVEKLHGICHVHAGALAEHGIATIGQLRRVPKAALQAAFGGAIGQQIWERARGLDGREVLVLSTPKSVSRETTIEGGTIDTEFLGGLIEYLSERVGGTLRKYGKQARTLGLHLRYVDHFSAHQTVRLSKPANDERELLVAAKELFGKLFTRRVAVRLAGVSVTNLEADRRQNELFDTRANRRWYLNREMDRVRGRYGWNAVFYGKGLELREHYATKPNGLVLSTPCLSR